MAECVHGLDESQCATCSTPRAPRERTTDEVRKEFEAASVVSEDVRTRAARLGSEFAQERPSPKPTAVAYREEYAEHFSKEGLEAVTAKQLHRFANSDLVAGPGNMSIFNEEWKKRGEDESRTRVVEAIAYLLYGPPQTRLEDRLTDLIEGNRGMGFRGFKESLLTKVLCMVYPDTYLPILVYTSPGRFGKKEIAEAVFRVNFPKPERTQWQIGRLVIWSNDRLVDLLPDMFRKDLVWASDFLWWAKDQPWPEDS
jgi:hypothetical protein